MVHQLWTGLRNLLDRTRYSADLSFLITRTQDVDEPLFRELGLDPFFIRCREKYFVGEVKDHFEDDSWVKVWVQALPAPFWTFEVYCHETGHTYNISTGSGPLSRYWDTIEKIADGMIVINEIKEDKNDVTNE